MVPKAGPKNGIQCMNTATSAPPSATSRAVRHHDAGPRLSMRRGAGSAGSALASSWEVPGKRRSGYWREKVTSSTSCPRAASVRASEAWKWAMPPR